jgi:hypothetical protein
MSEKIGKASLRDAAIGTGVAVDKMLALVGQSPVGIQIANIAMPSEENGRRVEPPTDVWTRSRVGFGNYRQLAKPARLGTHAHAERHQFSQPYFYFSSSG